MKLKLVPSRWPHATLLLIAIGATCTLAGCGGNKATTSSADDNASFKGDMSRIPPGDRAKVDAAIKQAQNAAPSSAGPSAAQMEQAKQAAAKAQSGQ